MTPEEVKPYIGLRVTVYRKNSAIYCAMTGHILQVGEVGDEDLYRMDVVKVEMFRDAIDAGSPLGIECYSCQCVEKIELLDSHTPESIYSEFLGGTP